MKKVLITLTILLFATSMSFSQVESDTTQTTNQQTVIDTTEITQPPAEKEKKEKPKKEKQSMGRRVFYGGSVGLSFGSYTRIAVYPQLGLKITPKLSGGIELGYVYVTSDSYTTSSYGGSLFARYRIIPAIYLHAEYATYNYELLNPDDPDERVWVPFLFLGAGFVKKVGSSTYVFAEVKFDVLQDENSHYGWDPLFRVGVSVGF